jgi:catechol 2,3-dioxygenase-like lactoylglutathione lyase family enzyme
MQVESLDHVNIVVDDLAGAARFYADLLGLEPRAGASPQSVQWMYDARGRPIIHLNAREASRAYDRPMGAGPTGPIHHVAFECSGYEEMVQRLTERALGHQVRLGSAGFRQIFVHDPNGVLLELNFPAD